MSQALQKWTRRKKWKVRNCFSAQVRAACLPLEGGGCGALWCQQRAGGGPEIRRWAALEAAGGLRLGAVAQWP